MSESGNDPDAEMDQSSDSSSEDEKDEDCWYEEVNDVEYIQEIVEPLKTKKYHGLLKWLFSTFQDEANEREDILLDGQIPDWHCSINDTLEIKEMIAAIPMEEMGSLSQVLHQLKLRAANVETIHQKSSSKIIPHSKKAEKSMKRENTVKVLTFLKLLPPKQGEYEYPHLYKETKVQFWTIPSKWTKNELWAKIKFLEAMGYKYGDKEIRKRDVNLALKWVKSEKLNGDVHGSFLFPQEDKMKKLMKKPSTVNFLTFMNILPPSEDNEHWKIPRNMSVEALDSKGDFIENIFFRKYPLQKLDKLNRPLVGNFKKRKKLVNVERCKECDIVFKCLLQHLKKSKKCSHAYDQNDMKDLKESSKNMTRVRHKKYEQDYKNYRKQQKADHYQATKSHRSVQMDEYYRKNRAKIAKKQAEYYLKNKEKIAKKKAEKYQNEKESI